MSWTNGGNCIIFDLIYIFYVPDISHDAFNQGGGVRERLKPTINCKLSYSL